MSDIDHLGWQISALLDGELTTVEEDVALDHLSTCERCQEELAEITAARELVRSLGEAEPPEDYDATRLGGARSGRLGLVGLVTLAAAWVIILAVGLGLSLPDTAPSVDEFADQHSTVSSIADESDRMPERADGFEQFETGEIETLAAPYAAPPTLGPSLDRVAGYGGAQGVVQLFYSDGELAVSVFEQEGTLDRRQLPPDGSEVDVGEQQGWIRTVGDPPQTTLVVAKGSLVYTLVSTMPAADLVEVAENLPDGASFSLSERARRNFAEVVRRLGVGAAAAEPQPEG